MLKVNRESVFKKAGIPDPASVSSSIFNFALEVQSVRKIVRESNLFRDPEIPSPLMSFDGKMLHPTLVNFYTTAISNYHLYLEDVDAELAPIFVTYDDENAFHDINNWTIDKIDDEISKLVDKQTDEQKQRWVVSLKTIKRKKKVHHVQLLQNLREHTDLDVTTESANLREELELVMVENPQPCHEIYMDEE